MLVRDVAPFEAICVGSGTVRHTLSTAYILLQSPPDQAPSMYMLNLKQIWAWHSLQNKDKKYSY